MLKIAQIHTARKTTIIILTAKWKIKSLNVFTFWIRFWLFFIFPKNNTKNWLSSITTNVWGGYRSCCKTMENIVETLLAFVEQLLQHHIGYIGLDGPICPICGKPFCGNSSTSVGWQSIIQPSVCNSHSSGSSQSGTRLSY